VSCPVLCWPVDMALIIVSSSYRDLLGTADRIIQLDQRMQETEKLLGYVSLQCNLDIIDKKARHLAEVRGLTAQQSSFFLPCRSGSSELIFPSNSCWGSSSHSSAFSSPKMSEMSSKTLQTRWIHPDCCESTGSVSASEQARWTGRPCSSALGVNQTTANVAETTLADEN
jgi:hypothetical protein